jgi:glutamate synthase (NADPH/NADH) small chain
VILRPSRIGPFPFAKANTESRKKDFSEVRLPYNQEQVMLEAERCLSCGSPICADACPLYADVRGMNEAVARGDFETAFKRITETNPLPGTTARLCPQLCGTCEQACALQWEGESVSIGMIQRFVADWERAGHRQPLPKAQRQTGKRISIVGSGPAGLAAGDLLRRYGHSVTIYEEAPASGGLLCQGVPDYRLPRDIIRYEIERLEGNGLEIRTDVKVGTQVTLERLFSQGSDAVLISSIPDKSTPVHVQGADLGGVYDAKEFLSAVYADGVDRYQRRPRYDLGRKVLVIGSNETAVDAARTAIRLTGGDSTIVFDGTERETAGYSSLVQEAREEGVSLKFQFRPKFFRGVGGRVVGVTMSSTALSEPDDTGTGGLLFPHAEFTFACSSVILTSRRAPDYSRLREMLAPVTTTDARLDDLLSEASKKGVFVVGDLPAEPSSVGLSMAQGREVAQRMHEYLMGLQAKHVSLYDRYFTERTKPKAYWDMLLGTDEVPLPP